MGLGLSILEMVRQNMPIDVNVGTFGGKGSVYQDKWVDRFDLRTTETSKAMFKVAGGTPGKTVTDTNTPANSVPGGQRWDLMGMFWQLQKVDGTAIIAAEKAAFNAWVQSMRVSVKFGQSTVFDYSVWAEFGSQLSQETAITPTLALQSSSPKAITWGGLWREECHLPLAANVVLDVNLQFAAPAAAIAVADGAAPTFRLAAWFDRIVAYQN